MGNPPLGKPNIAVDMPAGADGAAFDAYAGHLSFSGAAALVDPADRPTFHASVAIWILGPVLVSDTRASHPIRLTRTLEDVARTGMDHLSLTLHVEGEEHGVCGGRPFHAGPGDVSVMDFASPFDLTMGVLRRVAVTAPRADWPEPVRAGAAPPVLARDRAATRLLAGAFRELFAALPDLTTPEAEASLRALSALAGAATVDADGETPPTSSRRVALDAFDRARADIERGLNDPALSAASVAAASRVSRSALYDLFRPHGGVHAYIVERRLQRGYERLSAGLDDDQPLAAIAFDLGFRSEAHFSRSFKARFGLGPAALRAAAHDRAVHVPPPRARGGVPDTLKPTR